MSTFFLFSDRRRTDRTSAGRGGNHDARKIGKDDRDGDDNGRGSRGARKSGRCVRRPTTGRVRTRTLHVKREELGKAPSEKLDQEDSDDDSDDDSNDDRDDDSNDNFDSDNFDGDRGEGLAADRSNGILHEVYFRPVPSGPIPYVIIG